MKRWTSIFTGYKAEHRSFELMTVNLELLVTSTIHCNRTSKKEEK
jgi:hypothetical protein